MRIAVTEQDIKEGRQGSYLSCPIALAIQRTTEARSVLVGRRTANVDGTVFVLPASAEFFVGDFDAGESVEPFEFDLIHISKL